MSTQIGRISGALLKDNLLRNGVDLAFETELLYLDVNTNKIGIRSSSPIRDLYSPTEIRSTNTIVDNLATINSMITIDNAGDIKTFFDDLYVTAPQIVATHFGVGDFDIDSNKITVTTSNADFDLRPDGNGILKIVNDLDVLGNLHSTGNITLDGTITFGSGTEDNISFLADVNSNILPDIDLTYSLGKVNQTWKNIYSDYLNGQVIEAGTIEVGPIVPSTRQGNIWYVATNGKSDNVGNHQNGPFESVERALNHAVFGDTVYIYPGIYYELLPLTVPAGVQIKGNDLRNTIITPDTASGGQDVFLLNDGCTVSDITVKDHTFDSLNNKGYAFRFANGINIQTRSPYVQNTTIITSGPSAGKGAYIDGSVADVNTNEASMLFHSVTCITPGVDTITMLNGVRVEWLNSFTYFAERGLYALQGAAGLSSLGTRFGAEVRSIGSANVYGTYGAVADGADTLMYLINHNFAYVGTGTDTSNDRTLVIQANETVELNSGKIHYTSFDHVGTFRVGDTFWIDLKNGTTSFDLSSISVGDLAGIKFTNGDQVTYVDYSKVETGNIQISGNTIRSTVGSIDITSASNTINLDQDVFVYKNLVVSNNVNISGQLTLGNQAIDTVVFDAEIDDNLDPKLNATYNIGSVNRSWENVWLRNAEISDIEINTNYIRTTISNADLELRANSTGSILVEGIRVNQNLVTTDSGNLRIEPATTLDITASTTNINGELYLPDNVSIDSDTTFGTSPIDIVDFNSLIDSDIEPQVDSTYSLGDSQRSWNLFAAELLLDDIRINDNFIETTVSNLDLELKASGVGSVLVEDIDTNENLITTPTNLRIEPATTLDITASNTIVDSNFHVTDVVTFNSDTTLGTDPIDNVYFRSYVSSNIEPQTTSAFELGSSTNSWNLYTGKILLDEIEINDNYIQTTVSNLDLVLKANGTGSVQLEKTYINENTVYTVGTNLKIEPATTLDITASTSNVNGNLHVTQNVYIDSNTTFGNSNTDLVKFDSRINTDIIPDTSHTLGSASRAWNLYTSSILLDDIEINDNYIRTTASNLNLELKANGTGAVSLEKVDFNENVIKTNGTTNLIIDPDTTLDIFANTTVNANIAVTGDFDWQGNITFGNATTDDLVFVSDINSDVIPDIDDTYNLGSLQKRWNTLWVDNSYIGGIEINTNYIRTVESNANLELYGNGTGGVKAEDLRFRNNTIEGVVNNQNIQVALTGSSILDTNADTALRIPRGTVIDRPISNMSFGELRFNTTDSLFSGFTTARVTFGGVYSADRLTYARVEPTSNIITFVSDTTPTLYANSFGLDMNGLTVQNVVINSNTITNTLGAGDPVLTRVGDSLVLRDGSELIINPEASLSAVNLIFDPDGSNTVNVDDITFDDNFIISPVTNSVVTLSHTTGKGYLKFDGTIGFVMPSGADSERSLSPAQGTTRWSTDNAYMEIYIGTQWQLATAAAGSTFATAQDVEDINYLWNLILG